MALSPKAPKFKGQPYGLPWIILLSALFTVSTALADANIARLIGGKTIDPTKYPFALIKTEGSICSGVLISKRAILTAGHCTFSEPDLYRVVVGGNNYSVTKIVQNTGYKFELEATIQNIRYDLGVLILDREVRNLTPYPILTDYSLRSGEPLTSIGFGLTENANEPVGYQRAKLAPMRLSRAKNGALFTYYDSSNSIICSGDSGGPLLVRIGGRSFVAAISAAGTSDDDPFGSCLVGGGESVFTDLRSTSSAMFLRSVSGVRFVSGRLALFLDETSRLIRSVQTLRKERDLPTLQLEAREILKRLPEVRGQKRSKLQAKIATELRLAYSNRSLRRSKAKLEQALKLLKQLRVLGPS